MVLQEASYSFWNHSIWVITGRSHLPHHGLEAHSTDRLSLDHESGCLRDFGHASPCQPDGEVKIDSSTQEGRCPGVSSPSEGTSLCYPLLRLLLFLLRDVLTVQLCDSPVSHTNPLYRIQLTSVQGPKPWHVDQPGHIRDSHPERSLVSCPQSREHIERLTNFLLVSLAVSFPASSPTASAVSTS
jgi:hypothetical protein